MCRPLEAEQNAAERRFAARAKFGATTSHRIRRRTMETDGFFPTYFLSFLRVLIYVETSFAEEEKISFFLTSLFTNFFTTNC
jgi:hypothetical protein